MNVYCIFQNVLLKSVFTFESVLANDDNVEHPAGSPELDAAEVPHTAFLP